VLHELWDDPEGESGTATISTWEDITSRWESSSYRRYVQEALMLPNGLGRLSWDNDCAGLLSEAEELFE